MASPLLLLLLLLLVLVREGVGVEMPEARARGAAAAGQERGVSPAFRWRAKIFWREAPPPMGRMGRRRM